MPMPLQTISKVHNFSSGSLNDYLGGTWRPLAIETVFASQTIRPPNVVGMAINLEASEWTQMAPGNRHSFSYPRLARASSTPLARADEVIEWPSMVVANGRFCCRSPLRIAASSDSVAPKRSAAEACDDGVAEARTPASALWMIRARSFTK